MWPKFTYSLSVFSETIEPISIKFHMQPPGKGGRQVYIVCPGHITKITAMPIITADNSTLRISYRFIQSLTFASGNRLFGSVVEHWVLNPEARVQIPPKSWDFFCLMCYVLFFVTAFMS